MRYARIVVSNRCTRVPVLLIAPVSECLSQHHIRHVCGRDLLANTIVTGRGSLKISHFLVLVLSHLFARKQIPTYENHMICIRHSLALGAIIQLVADIRYSHSAALD